MNVIQNAYDSVYQFNDIAGNFDGIAYYDMQCQLNFIREELEETQEALIESNQVELLDGACDLFVTVAGLMQKLAVKGYDVSAALTRVCENNMSKFPKIENRECVWPKEYQAMVNEEYNVIVLKNKDGKIMKPPGFVTVDLTDLVPA